MSPLRNCSHIVLACTHYPAIEETLLEFVSPDTEFIDPAEAVAGKVRKWKLDPDGDDRFFTSGDVAQMKRSAKLAFGIDIKKVTKVSV